MAASSPLGTPPAGHAVSPHRSNSERENGLRGLEALEASLYSFWQQRKGALRRNVRYVRGKRGG